MDVSIPCNYSFFFWRKRNYFVLREPKALNYNIKPKQQLIVSAIVSQVNINISYIFFYYL